MNRPRRRTPLLMLAIPLLLAACSSAAAPPSATPSSPPSSAEPSPAPSGTAPSGTAPVEPSPGEGGGGGGQMPGGPGELQPVVPVPGQQMVHEVAVSEIRHEIVEGRVVLNVRWWGGVEPCAVLDSVDVARDGNAFRITLHEGTSDPDAICIMIAVEKVTVVDLGPLEPGTYTVEGDPGEAPPLEIVVP